MKRVGRRRRFDMVGGGPPPICYHRGTLLVLLGERPVNRRLIMSNELRVTLVSKPRVPAASKKRPVTADELCKAMSDRAWKILNGEPVERSGPHLNSY